MERWSIIEMLSVIFGGGYLLFIFRRQNDQLDKKVNKERFDTVCQQMKEDFSRGADEFKAIHADIKEMAKNTAIQSELIARLDERINFAMRRIDSESKDRM